MRLLKLSLLLGFCLNLHALDRPNVLFIAVDDINDWVGVFGGHPQARTPHLDRFAASGAVTFQNAHCAGPVCGPSRSALLSGFMPHRTGLYGNQHNMLDSRMVQTHATLPEYFSKHGYHSLSMGKIFHRHVRKKGTDAGQWAFDEYHNTTGGTPVDRSQLTSRDKNLIHGKPGPKSKYTKGGGSEFSWGPTSVPLEETRDFLTAQWAAEQLNKEHGNPFFLAVGLSRPHLPFYVPQKFFDLYPLETFKAPEIREDDLGDILDPRGKPAFRPSDDYLWLKENGLITEAARAYMAACSYADACLSVVFDALEKSPRSKDTIVVFWGDHGWHLGEKLRYRKGTGWRESTRVPLIVRLPGSGTSAQSNRLVNLIDLYPTLIDLCGLPEKRELDGKSFAPLLSNPGMDWQNHTLTIFGPGNASIQDEGWHLLHHRDGTRELYDLKNDPMEWTNLIQSKDANAKAAFKRLATHVPTEFAEPIPNSKGIKPVTKGLDKTVKPGRSLNQLK